ncbi:MULTISPECIES: carbohydrate ABC transporter permease [Alteribacter]|uniref:Sugar ABC transporter permease n=1 Tax=Alteribacter keqinensis TaxID=2483800 RepID=A0A3M7TR12_9BACI|nr:MULTISPECIES: sugar ABC transporter permease [Alteribacter]MBM7095779.1 sugar ABC transporter permease [Alteribacter salitolerans]RNA67619.1 sugar ABC transporter permease [Alteribacter keqinensis]
MRLKRFMKKYKLEIAMFMPIVLYIAYFTIVPIINTVSLSFQNPRGSGLTLGNYTAIFNNINFNAALFNTLFITLIGIVLQLSIAIVVALILKQKFKGRGFFRTMMLIPMGVPTLVSGVTLLFIFGQTGYFNEMLLRLGLIENQNFWLGGGIDTLFVIIFADMWKVLPLTILLLLAGLEAISDDVYEASSLDGANRWETFWNITLPLLKPSITMAIILRAIDAFRIFELPLVMAGRNAPVLSTFSFEEFRRNNFEMAGAAASILLVIILIFITLYILLVEMKKFKGGKAQ